MRLQTLFLAATLVASSTSAYAAPISKLFVFGDSVSDNGNLYALTFGAVPAPPYLPGRAQTRRRVCPPLQPRRVVGAKQFRRTDWQTGEPQTRPC